MSKTDEELGREFNRVSRLEKAAESERRKMNRIVATILGAIAGVVIFLIVLYMAGAF